MKRITTFLLILILGLSAIACSGGAQGAALPHFDGLNADGTYDSDVFYRNDLTIFGGDSDVIWVPEGRHDGTDFEDEDGWFYQYTSGNGGVYTTWPSGATKTYAYSCLRSKDLNDWELCGAVDDGFAMEVDISDWAYNNMWAPEVIYDQKTGWYVLYSSMIARQDRGIELPFYSTSGDINFCAIGISENPCGPFTMVSAENFYRNAPLYRNSDEGMPLEEIQDLGNGVVGNLNGEDITNATPPIHPSRYFSKVTEGKNAGINFSFGHIDLSPFVDDNGDMYLYFAKHWLSQTTSVGNPLVTTGAGSNMSIWAMKMKDAITPDYESLRLITFPGFSHVEYDTEKNGPIWLESSYILSGHYTEENARVGFEDRLNEGPQMIAHTSADGVKRYYLTYSHTGFAARDYGCHIAVSESPLGPFQKEARTKSPLTVDVNNDFMTGVGHHAMTEVEDETYLIYWVHADPNDASTSQYNGRAYAFDKINWIYDAEAGYDLMIGNGPTKSLQFLPKVACGYENIAESATVTATNAKNSVKFINDDIVPCLEYFAENNEFIADGSTEIKLTFPEAREVRGIAIYNSWYYKYAFSQIDFVEFELAQKPAWYDLSEYNGFVHIKNLGFNKDYFNDENPDIAKRTMRPGGASVASFEPIKVKSIRIKVSKKLAGESGEIRISDIAVLGK